MNGQGVDLDIQGKLDWTSALETDFDAVIRQLDLSPWMKDWPVGKSIEGKYYYYPQTLDFSAGQTVVKHGIGQLCQMRKNLCRAGPFVDVHLTAKQSLRSGRHPAGFAGHAVCIAHRAALIDYT